MRASSPTCSSAREIAGMVEVRSQPSGSSVKAMYPPVGSQPSQTAKNRIISSPSQKFGIEMPTIASIIAS
jgi:hypothetical protein